MKSDYIILGAGLTGLLAGVMLPNSTIYEARSKPENLHKAILRFRSLAVSERTGIPFRKVKVYKSIWFDQKHVGPSPKLANWYSSKVVGKVMDRSIWDVEPVERYVAPLNFYEQMVDLCHNRIIYNSKVLNISDEWIDVNSPFSKLLRDTLPIVSTIPMPELLKVVSPNTWEGIISPQDFPYREIFVTRYEIPGCDVFQTIYFPGPDTDIYRVSITGNILTIESISEFSEGPHKEGLFMIADVFGLSLHDWKLIDDNYAQAFGKIAPINNSSRINIISALTEKFNIYSLGRFATWRNIVLDEVVNDVTVIERLIKLSSGYDRRLQSITRQV